MKYPAIHFSFFTFRNRFRIFCDKCIANFRISQKKYLPQLYPGGFFKNLIFLDWFILIHHDAFSSVFQFKLNYLTFRTVRKNSHCRWDQRLGGHRRAFFLSGMMILCKKNVAGWIMRRMWAIWVLQVTWVSQGEWLMSMDAISGDSPFLSFSSFSYQKACQASVKLKNLARGQSFLSQDTNLSKPMRKSP